jgi:hypothetical protein
MSAKNLNDYNPQIIRDSILSMLDESVKMNYDELELSVLLDLEAVNNSQNIQILGKVFTSLISSGKLRKDGQYISKTSSNYEYDYNPQTLEPTSETSILIKGEETIYSIGSHYYFDNWVGLNDGHFINVDVIREPNNPYDKNAVAICYQGKIMGHLTREDAKSYNDSLRLLEEYNFFMTVPAYIDSDFRKESQYRFLKLFMPKPELILQEIM